MTLKRAGNAVNDGPRVLNILLDDLGESGLILVVSFGDRRR